jgi:hypothetical protein
MWLLGAALFDWAKPKGAVLDFAFSRIEFARLLPTQPSPTIRRVPVDKNEGVVKRHLCAAMLFRTASRSELVEDRSSGSLTVNQFSVKSFHQPSIRPITSAMILLSESQFALGRERPINSST